MSFSQELKDFVTSTNAGMKLGNDARENAAKASHYAALEKYYDAKTPDDTPAINPDYIAEGRSVHGVGGPGMPGAALPTETPDSYDPTKAPPYLADVSKKYSAIPADYLSKTAWIENRFRPTGGNDKSSAGGLFQFTDNTAKQYALADKNNPLASADAAARYAVDNAKGLRGALGRDPTGAELYLAHQQGLTGATQLLRNPNTPAASIVGRDAVINNGGNDRMTAGEFANLWLNKYNNLAPHAACGGMVHHYEDGGAVEKPYYATDLMSDVGNALGKLGDVVRGGFQSIADTFGLHQQPAVANADPDYMKRVEAFVRDPGADPQQVQEVKRTVDPDNQLGDALATTYGMVKSYEHHLANGNQQAANKAAGQILLYTRFKSQQLGALALHAMQEGDESTATKALAQAYNFLPNSQKLEMQDGKAILVDQKSGKPIREVEFTPATLLKAAYGFSNGEAFLNDLQGVMQSEKEKVAGINAQGKIEAASIGANAKTDTATINAGSREKVAEGHDRTSAANNQNTNETNKAIAVGHDETSAANTAANNVRAVDVANINQGGANYRADKASETSLANNQNTNTTNKEIAGIRVEGQQNVANTRAQSALDVAGVKETGANQRTEATNNTRKDIAAGNNETKVRTTMDVLDARKEEGAANRASREGQNDKRIASRQLIAADKNTTALDIADKKINSQEKQTTEKVDASNQRAANRVASQEKINANNNATSRANTQDKIDATAANSAVKIDADKQKVDAANQEADRRLGAKGAATRQGSQLTRLDKMTDHAILGVDETTTPTVSAGQAQATRNIARGIVEAGGSKIAGDEAASYARQMTKWDPVAKRPKVQVKLNPADNTVTMPDGVTIPLSESAFKEVARIHGGAR